MKYLFLSLVFCGIATTIHAAEREKFITELKRDKPSHDAISWLDNHMEDLNECSLPAAQHAQRIFHGSSRIHFAQAAFAGACALGFGYGTVRAAINCPQNESCGVYSNGVWALFGLYATGHCLYTGINDQITATIIADYIRRKQQQR